MNMGHTITLTVPEGMVAQITIADTPEALAASIVPRTSRCADARAAPLAIPASGTRVRPVTVFALTVGSFVAGIVIANGRAGASRNMLAAVPLPSVVQPHDQAPTTPNSGDDALRAFNNALRTEPRIEPPIAPSGTPALPPGASGGSGNPFGLKP